LRHLIGQHCHADPNPTPYAERLCAKLQAELIALNILITLPRYGLCPRPSSQFLDPPLHTQLGLHTYEHRLTEMQYLFLIACDISSRFLYMTLLMLQHGLVQRL